MALNVYFDTKNNIEIINEKIFPLGENFINFISLDIDNILNEKNISNLSQNNYKDIIFKLATASDGTIIKELINIDNISIQNDIQQIKKDLRQLLYTYKEFKEATEFCFFNDNINAMTLLQKYIYYLHISNAKKVKLPKQTINFINLKPIEKNNNDILIMLEKNSPYLCFSYECLNINDYMIVTFLQLIENNYLILKCKNCGKYFIPYKRTDTYYCDRQSPQDKLKSCKQYGADKAWWVRTKDENDWYNLYRKIYQSFQVKAKRNPNDPQHKKNYDNFRKEANEWKQAVKKGIKTEADFMKWLQDFRKNK